MYQTKSKRCLGIDPGLANTGYAIIGRKAATEEFKLLESGCIQTDRKVSTEAQRLLKIYQDIGEIIGAHTPHLVAIEKVYFNSYLPRRNIPPRGSVKTFSVPAVSNTTE